MKKWSLNQLEIGAVNLEIKSDLISSLKTPIREREKFKYNSSVVTMPRYFYRFIGVEKNEERYFDYLCKLDRELSLYGNLYMKVTEGLERSISPKIRTSLDSVWRRIKDEYDVNTSQVIRYLDDNNLFPKLSNSTLDYQIKTNLKGILDYYVTNNPQVKIDDSRNIVDYIIFWINMYTERLFYNFDYLDINPKVLFYGEITEEEALFLTFISTLGCDILYYNPESCEEFNRVDKHNAFSMEIKYNNKMGIKPFPKHSSGRVETVAYNAKEELDKTLYHEESKFYRPWQFADYDLQAVTLKTTYEEIKIWSKEKAYIRDGWRVENGRVYIPNMFAKISGTYEELEKYWKDINDLITQGQTKFYNKLPIMGPIHLEYSKFNAVAPQGYRFNFDTNKLLSASWWKYKELRTGLQRAIAEKIRELCLNPVFINRDNDEFRDFQVEIFSILINIDMGIMEMLQGNDYAQEVPKIIIYNNEKNGNLSFEDCVMLTFMNYMGIDVIIFNPSGYNDIENYIYPDLYDIHILENMSFKLDFKKYEEKKGFFKKLFGL